ncbi:TetR/AcrR family transcriptional regulator [Paenibacillus lutrae]|uniref:TetR family transcriptional regulator n=1 Tax=Paenibacillus lutrae TaxID=2078573 RepID=A0A7X3FKN3_9BACL|nr:TetR/AcrR family transcriptional regulator [Paenibacillus lutrae]MVP01468.1 TetR family transcriptional regulator [Paenibacillus lutrae]
MKAKSKTDPRIVRSRQMFRDALIELIKEEGYDSLTVQKIAARADLNRATFYLHYRDKQDLMQQSVNEVFNELTQSLHLSEMNPSGFDYQTEEPHPAFLRLFEHIGLYAGFYEVILNEPNLPGFTGELTEVISRFVTAGINTVAPRDNQLNVPREMLVSYTSAAFLGVIGWWLKNDRQFSPKYMAAKTMLLAIKGPYAENPFMLGESDKSSDRMSQ